MIPGSPSVTVEIPEVRERGQGLGQDQGQVPDWASMSLMDKLRNHYKKGNKAGTRTKHPVRFLFVFQAVTQLYVTLTTLMPDICEECHPAVLYCLQVWACYVCVMSVANWLCVILYSRGNAYKPTRDRPDLPLPVSLNGEPPETFQGRLHHAADQHAPRGGHVNGHVTMDVTEKGGLPWHYCEECDRSVPPRAHHCKFCNACILRRDHHCHLVATCIGHFNQRYFVILAGYAQLVGYVGVILTITYLRHHHPPHLSYWSYFLPVTFYKWVVGEVGGLQFLLTYHVHMLCLFAPVGTIYFMSQLSIIAQGKTLYEVAKKKNVRVTSSVEENVRLVFGDYWMLNFLLPLQIIFRQPSDGLHYTGIKILPDEIKDKDKVKVEAEGQNGDFRHHHHPHYQQQHQQVSARLASSEKRD